MTVGLLVSATPSQAATEYAGTVVGDPSATVSFRIKASQRGDPRAAVFSYSNVQIFFDDGTTGRQSGPGIEVPFRTKRMFHGEFFAEDNAGQFFDEYRGVLRRGGKASGYLVQVNDYFQPPNPGQPPLTDSSTHGRVRWKAQRTG